MLNYNFLQESLKWNENFNVTESEAENIGLAEIG